MISMLRVDHRLLHGQVIYSWLKSIDCNSILIANDAVANDEVRQQLLKISAPADKKLVIRTLEKSISILANPKNQLIKFFIIVEDLHDAWRLAEKIDEINQINIGSIKSSPDAQKINNAVYLTNEAKVILRRLKEKHIALDVRQVATETAINIDSLL